MKIDVSRLCYEDIEKAFQGASYLVCGIAKQGSRVLLECAPDAAIDPIEDVEGVSF